MNLCERIILVPVKEDAFFTEKTILSAYLHGIIRKSVNVRRKIMRKAFVAMLCMILLSGCQGAKSDLPDRILKELNELTTQEFQGGTNRFKRRYAYYLPQGMGQRDQGWISLDYEL